MKLQNLHEGIQARTQKTRSRRRLNFNTGNYQDILEAVAEALIPIIEGDEADMFHDMRADPDTDYTSIEDYFSRLDTDETAKYFGSNLIDVLQTAWEKKWNID